MKLLYRLLLVRHGQADSNQRGAFLGRQDDPLTEKGREQAASLRDRMTHEQIDIMVASPLKRASSTADILVEHRDLTFETDPRLMEQDYGKWDGITFPEAKDRFPRDFQSWMSGNPEIGPTGGENLTQVTARVMDCYQDRAPAIPAGGTMMWVSHAGALQSLLCRKMGLDLCNQWPFMLQPGSLAELQIYDTGPRLTRLSWV